MKRRQATILILLAVAVVSPAMAHPEFQRDIVKRTGRAINCALCHEHADGPEGTAPGQIGRLSAAELEQLGRARAALQPGSRADSPILNAFGDLIIEKIGKARFLELKLAPAVLPSLLPADGDLDRDGIPDARELAAGTHPLLATDGDPWLLLRHNARRNAGQIALTLAATVLGLYGLRSLLMGIAIATRSRESDELE
ncbi:hypothetical protein FJ250_10395 [bacterium]|nr:hypothetical protein [bacterium]